MPKKSIQVFAVAVLSISLTLLKTTLAPALMLELSTSELTRRADAIVRGKVVDMRSEWDPERRYIWTLVTVAVADAIKGDSLAGHEVIVKTPGGVVDNIGQRTGDAATFAKGEEVLLFMTPEVYRGSRVFRLTGNFQGKHTVKDNMVIEKNMPVTGFVGEIKKAK